MGTAFNIGRVPRSINDTQREEITKFIAPDRFCAQASDALAIKAPCLNQPTSYMDGSKRSRYDWCPIKCVSGILFYNTGHLQLSSSLMFLAGVALLMRYKQ